MMQSIHAAIIMDGNGRWAEARGWPRVAGHRAGVEALRRVAEAAPRLGVGTLTLYAFSADNWKRPVEEVSALMGLFQRYLQTETERCVREGVRVSVIGRRDRLAPAIRGAIESAERLTAGGAKLHLRLAVDYSGRQSIAEGTVGPDVDLLIRTGGEQRLSDFLLWESAYAELYFTTRMWPDFGGEALEEALDWFRRRQRRFGGLPAAEPAGVALR
jgi:undecaprenyl diphosphate synthase